ncbi:hypothetical protein [Nonomuraea aurantiaca]|uniref:hypothetical protein n=1 Tax=Nonomuraea aurantiaca TaxID=2878562 RepID=UPI001CDA24CD|nr:hypothetical protein [Nonomuraea aurantiaca]MCA2228284.1 hypothetical protein [Nonomuraea aurantiaca]
MLAVDERGSGANEGDEVWCVDRAPASLGGLDQLEGLWPARERFTVTDPVAREMAGQDGVASRDAIASSPGG